MYSVLDMYDYYDYIHLIIHKYYKSYGNTDQGVSLGEI